VKVLLLDKDKKRIKLFKEVLKNQDYDILVAKHGKNAIKHLGEDSPELIITDFDVPGGGVDLVNAILTLKRDQFPYVLFITEEQGEKFAVDCLGPIPGDFLLKPIKEQELRARISVAERAIALQSHLRSARTATVDLAMYDELTNLMNRQAVYERALGELNRAQRDKIQVCLAMIEVLNVEDVKSEYGEDISNQAIRYVARTARANVRMYDLVGRWIGAKFFLMLPGLPHKHIHSVIERINDAIAAVRVKLPEGDVVPIEIAVGFTWSDVEKPEPLYVLIEQANDAISEAAKKDSGRKIASHRED